MLTCVEKESFSFRGKFFFDGAVVVPSVAAVLDMTDPARLYRPAAAWDQECVVVS